MTPDHYLKRSDHAGLLSTTSRAVLGQFCELLVLAVHSEQWSSSMSSADVFIHFCMYARFVIFRF